MNGELSYERWTLLDGRGQEWFRSRVCPRRLITDDTRAWLELYASYDAGFLLVSGGVFDQPAIYLQAMNAVRAAVQGDRNSGEAG